MEGTGRLPPGYIHVGNNNRMRSPDWKFFDNHRVQGPCLFELYARTTVASRTLKHHTEAVGLGDLHHYCYCALGDSHASLRFLSSEQVCMAIHTTI